MGALEHQITLPMAGYLSVSASVGRSRMETMFRI